jgi:hypothetical protein
MGHKPLQLFTRRGHNFPEFLIVNLLKVKNLTLAFLGYIYLLVDIVHQTLGVKA